MPFQLGQPGRDPHVLRDAVALDPRMMLGLLRGLLPGSGALEDMPSPPFSGLPDYFGPQDLTPKQRREPGYMLSRVQYHPSSPQPSLFAPPPSRQFGLTGLDPRMLNDPRFRPLQRQVLPSGQVTLGFPNTGESVFTTLDPRIHVNYLADVDDQTLADDMWAVTAGGHMGTSVGDRASQWFIQHSRDIVGNARQITPAMIQQMRARLLAEKYGEVRQTHPGLGGYTPQGLRY